METALETDLVRSLDIPHVIGFAYARHGLTSILNALGAEPGSEVVLSPLTCKVIPLAILSLQLKPVYADIAEDTLNLDPSTLQSALGAKSRAVLFQHTYGQPGGIDEVVRQASAHGVPVIEDCAQCMPLATQSPSPGASGVAGIFSNNLRKPLPAGSGGLAVMRDAGLASRVRAQRDSLPRRDALSEVLLRAEVLAHKWLLGPRMYWPLYGLSRRLRSFYKHSSVDQEIAGDIDAAARCTSPYQQRLGRRWLIDLERIVEHRRAACRDYAAALANVPGLELPIADSGRPLYYFPVFVERKDELLETARRRRIELVAWPIKTVIYPIEDAALLPNYGYLPGSCPVAERVAGKLVGLPTDQVTTPRHRAAVVDLLERHHGVG